MDDWNMNPSGGTPWRFYFVIGILGIIVIAVGIAYAMSRVAPPH